MRYRSPTSTLTIPGKGRPFRTLRDIFSAHLESPGTRAYTVREAEGLFGRFGRVSVRTVVTVFDLRLGRRRFLPFWTHRLLPGRWGWNHLVTAYKLTEATVMEVERLSSLPASKS